MWTNTWQVKFANNDVNRTVNTPSYTEQVLHAYIHTYTCMHAHVRTSDSRCADLFLSSSLASLTSRSVFSVKTFSKEFLASCKTFCAVRDSFWRLWSNSISWSFSWCFNWEDSSTACARSASSLRILSCVKITINILIVPKILHFSKIIKVK